MSEQAASVRPFLLFNVAKTEAAAEHHAVVPKLIGVASMQGVGAGVIRARPEKTDIDSTQSTKL